MGLSLSLKARIYRHSFTLGKFEKTHVLLKNISIEHTYLCYLTFTPYVRRWETEPIKEQGDGGIYIGRCSVWGRRG